MDKKTFYKSSQLGAVQLVTGVGGASGGAAIGFTIGLVGGIPGSIIGTVVGGIIGGIGGRKLGTKLYKKMDDKINEQMIKGVTYPVGTDPESIEPESLSDSKAPFEHSKFYPEALDMRNYLIALEVLGVDDSHTTEEIIQAYEELINQLNGTSLQLMES